MTDIHYAIFKAKMDKLNRFHWSPRHPSTYVLEGGAGLGKVAHLDYGAFNLVFYLTPLQTLQDHIDATLAFTEQANLNQQVLHGQTLSEWATMLDPKAFKQWYRRNAKLICPPTRIRIDNTLQKLEQLQVLRH